MSDYSNKVKHVDINGAKKEVQIVGWLLGTVNDHSTSGDLIVYCNPEDWDAANGAIYPNALFLKEMQEHFNSIGLDGETVEWAAKEKQGAGGRGECFVTFDIGRTFLATWDKKYKAENYAN